MTTRDELIEMLAANEAKADGTTRTPFSEMNLARKYHLRNRVKNRLQIMSAAGFAVVPVEATGESIYAALESSIAIMDEHKVNRLSPDDKGEPSPSLVARKAYAAMIRAADLAKEPGQ